MFKNFKKAMTPVVATALLLVVGVLAVIGFEGWFSEFSSNLITDLESNSINLNPTSVEGVIGENLYIRSDVNSSISSIFVNGVNCNFNGSVTGLGKINISPCLNNLTGVGKIVIITGNQVIEKSIFIDSNVGFVPPIPNPDNGSNSSNSSVAFWPDLPYVNFGNAYNLNSFSKFGISKPLGYFGSKPDLMDGSIYVVGRSGIEDKLKGDFMILKFDINGSIDWLRGLKNIVNLDYGTDLVLDNQSSIYFTGFESSLESGTQNILFGKISKSGSFDFVKSIGNTVGPVKQKGSEIILSSDDFIYLLADTGYSYQKADFMILKFDLSGNLIWNKELSSNNYNFFRGIFESSDNKFFVVGSSDLTNAGTSEFGIIFKFDSDGSVIFSKEFKTGSSENFFNGGLSLADGNNLVIGHHFNGAQFDGVIIKFDNLGNIVWQKSVNGPLVASVFHSVSESVDGSIYVISEEKSTTDVSNSYSKHFPIVYKFDKDGNLIWAKEQRFVFNDNIMPGSSDFTDYVFDINALQNNGIYYTFSDFKSSYIFNLDENGTCLDCSNYFLTDASVTMADLTTVVTDKTISVGVKPSVDVKDFTYTLSTDYSGIYSYDLMNQNSLDFSGGDGSSVNPFKISSCVELQNAAKYPNMNFELSGNVDCSASSSWNSGTGFKPILLYNSNFDGNGFSISNLFIDRNEDSVGLFSYFYSNDNNYIQNLNLDSASISGYDYTGGLINFVFGEGSGPSIRNINISNLVLNGQDYTGGVSAFSKKSTFNNIVLKNSKVDGFNHVGGIGGRFDHPELNNLNFSGNVSGTIGVGGILGYVDSGTLNYLNVFGKVDGTTNVGGIFGNSMLSYTDKSVFNGNVSGIDKVGGILGYSGNSYTYKSSTNGYITGTNDVGGIFGKGYYSTIENTYNKADVSGTNRVGGLVGSDETTVNNDYTTYSTLRNSYSVGVVSGSTDVGGLVGKSGSYYYSGSYYNSVKGDNSYWDTQASGQATAIGTGDVLGTMTGRTTAQMMAQANFLSWNFGTIWNINESTSYPFLR